jgi:hypothetical protein
MVPSFSTLPFDHYFYIIKTARRNPLLLLNHAKYSGFRVWAIDFWLGQQRVKVGRQN